MIWTNADWTYQLAWIDQTKQIYSKLKPVCSSVGQLSDILRLFSTSIQVDQYDHMDKIKL